MGYVDEIKTCENLAEELFEELEMLVYSALMKDNKDDYLREIRELIQEYKPKILDK